MQVQSIRTLRSNLNPFISNQSTDTIFQQAIRIKEFAKRQKTNGKTKKCSGTP